VSRSFWSSIVALNLILAVAAAVAAPSDIGTTADRLGYEYVGAHPLAPNCPHNIYCYRVLVPAALEQIPLPPPVRWRAFAVTANAATGVLLSAVAVSVGAGIQGALIAAILFQTSFGATFAVFDPFTPDPAVFLAAALITLAWVRNWPVLALTVGVVGVLAKETVALVLTAAAIAAWLDQRRGEAISTGLATRVFALLQTDRGLAGTPSPHGGPVDSDSVSPGKRFDVFAPSPRPTRAARQWLLAVGTTWLVVLGFHLAMDYFAGWSEAGSGSADLAGGAWLGRWLADPTLTPAARLLYVFIPFGFGWLFALCGVAHAPRRLKYLALGALIVLPWLIYVQTAERALATAAFVVVPLAAIFLARITPALAIAAALTNALLTARVGLSTAWLPPLPYLIALAAIVAALAIVRGLTAAPHSLPPWRAQRTAAQPGNRA